MILSSFLSNLQLYWSHWQRHDKRMAWNEWSQGKVIFFSSFFLFFKNDRKSLEKPWKCFWQNYLKQVAWSVIWSMYSKSEVGYFLGHKVITCLRKSHDRQNSTRRFDLEAVTGLKTTRWMLCSLYSGIHKWNFSKKKKNLKLSFDTQSRHK